MPTKFDLDTAFVRKLAKLLEETGLSEIEYAEGDKKIRCAISRGHVVHTAPAVAPMAAAVSAPAAAASGGASAVPAGAITAPMVGTVYLAASPDASPFVKTGDKVKEGDTLLIIEAMKVMNPIKAPKAGTIGEILVTNGKPVEFGEALIILS